MSERLQTRVPASHEVIEHVTSRERRGRPPARMALNLTSMIDVTFLLLIYFLVATRFRLGEEVYRLDLPERLPAQGVRDPFELDEEPLRIRVATTGSLPGAASYRLVIEGPFEQPRTFAELYEFLRSRRISDAVPGGLFLSDHPIVLEPTRTTRWQHALEAFNAAARAGYVNVTLGKSS